MRTLFPTASLVAVLASAGSLAHAQEPPKAPSPQMPATPSMDQKGADDPTKPAGALKPPPSPPVAHKGATAKPHAAAKQEAPAKHRVAEHGTSRHRMMSARPMSKSPMTKHPLMKQRPAKRKAR